MQCAAFVVVVLCCTRTYVYVRCALCVCVWCSLSPCVLVVSYESLVRTGRSCSSSRTDRPLLLPFHSKYKYKGVPTSSLVVNLVEITLHTHTTTACLPAPNPQLAADERLLLLLYCHHHNHLEITPLGPIGAGAHLHPLRRSLVNGGIPFSY